MRRPPIPRQLRRDVLVEAGHRCAIPTCRQPTVEIAHIEPWEKVKKHTFDNLIALCPNCHRRVHKGEIDRKALKQYKANLSILNGRYCDIERRVLYYFAEHRNESQIKLPGGLDIFLMYLLKDGYLRKIQAQENVVVWVGNFGPEWYELTPKGRKFIQKWLSGKKLR